MSRLFTGVLAILLPVATPAAAQEGGSTAPCNAQPALGAQPGSWDAPVRLVTAASVSGLDRARLELGQAANMALHPASLVTLPVPAGREGGNGGLATISIPAAGLYRVALGSAAWIDLVRDGRTISSTAHGHGAACSGIHKMVEFRLKRGSYTVVISGNGEMQTTLLVTPRPRDAPALHP